ncbi:MAG TPA: BlaI/MecI/CopY family transcriptional regulator [Patescibacteria group bacterium]|nr:BlaI/MecI/CopY family transcriptional regulator [Patescibacteria group bacterium]
MKNINLGELEKQIMDILWDYKSCSTRDILTILERDKKLAYTTVATILQRLFDKGLLTRKEDKSGHLYSPRLSKEKYSRNIAQSFLKNFIDSFGDTAIASFANSIDKLPVRKREYFLKILDEYDKDK